MAILKVSKSDKFIESISLSTDHSYLVGRGEGSDLLLDPEPGVSRRHFEIRFKDGQWQLELLSRHGELYVENIKVERVDLTRPARFSVPPYEFEFDPIQSLASIDPNQGSSDDASDRTAVMVLPSAGYLKLFNESGKNIQSFRLQGENWVAGRETTCPIFLDNNKISRRQFEIQRQGSTYFIRDLGSANGTLVNGEPIPSNDWVPLNSSDLISVIDWTLQFELRDESYEERLKEVDPGVQRLKSISVEKALEPGSTINQKEFEQSPQVAVSAQANLQANAQLTPQIHAHPQQIPMEMAANGVAMYQYPPGMYPQAPYPAAQLPQRAGKKKKKQKLNPIQMAIIGVLAIAVIGFVLLDDQPKKQIPKPVPVDSFSRLSKEQQLTVRQLYNNATQLFYQQKYQSARDELRRLHQIIPLYEDSKNLEIASEQAIQVQIDQERIRKQEEDQAKMEQQIQQQIAKCRLLLGPNVVASAIDSCLDPIIALNPQHKAILALRADLEKIITDRAMSAAREKEYNEAVERLEAAFKKAQSQAGTENFQDAISALRKVANMSGPDPRGRKGEAKKQIASIEKKMAELRAQYLSKSEEFYKDGKLRESILELEKAQKTDLAGPEVEAKIKERLLELRKQMQNIYQEGVLEESVGEVEAAKAKWKKILEMSVPSEEYYKKSQLKLKKYGVL